MSPSPTLAFINLFNACSPNISNELCLLSRDLGIESSASHNVSRIIYQMYNLISSAPCSKAFSGSLQIAKWNPNSLTKLTRPLPARSLPPLFASWSYSIHKSPFVPDALNFFYSFWKLWFSHICPLAFTISPPFYLYGFPFNF